MFCFDFRDGLGWKKGKGMQKKLGEKIVLKSFIKQVSGSAPLSVYRPRDH
jgi:hypothetical protein